MEYTNIQIDHIDILVNSYEFVNNISDSYSDNIKSLYTNISWYS